jgi:hypothetical protein
LDKTGEHGQAIQSAVRAASESLAALLKTNGPPQQLYLAGKSTRLMNFTPSLAESLGADCERIEIPADEGRSAAILGLKQSCVTSADVPPLVLRFQGAKAAVQSTARPMPWKWAAIATLLLLGLFSMRYAEAVLKKPGLSQKLAEIQAAREKLPEIERETRFLQFLDKSQPRYLDAITVLANAAASGSRFDSVSMNRRGDLSLRGTMRNSQQATEFRSKLLDSGMFLTVVIDEQTPTPDRQKINVRISARWKPTK